MRAERRAFLFYRPSFPATWLNAESFNFLLFDQVHDSLGADDVSGITGHTAEVTSVPFLFIQIQQVGPLTVPLKAAEDPA